MPLLLATDNSNKLKEFQALLNNSYLELIKPPQSLTIAETGKTFTANAIIKAKAYAQKFNQPTLADDSGLCIDYLNGQPGIHSHRFAPQGFAAARAKILKLLKGVPKYKRTARFICCLAFFDPKTKLLKTFTGKAEGWINKIEVGNSGFGYDQIFLSKDINKTFGEATLAEKNLYSHRAKALSLLLAWLK